MTTTIAMIIRTITPTATPTVRFVLSKIHNQT